MEIDNSKDWRKKHWMILYTNYKKTPYFNKYSDFFETVYKMQWNKLIDLLIYTMNFFFKELDIKTKFIKQSDLKTTEKKQELVLEICKKLNADTYIFGALGKNYAEEELFKNNGIKIYFQEYTHPSYTQQWGDFISHLSIVDLLFNVGPKDTLDIIMKDNIGKDALL